jgi:hypothetical protein
VGVAVLLAWQSFFRIKRVTRSAQFQVFHPFLIRLPAE